MKLSIFIALIFPISVFAGSVKEDQAAAVAACKGRILNSMCYDSSDCEDARMLKRHAINSFEEAGAQVFPLFRVIDAFERRWKAGHHWQSRPEAFPVSVKYYREADRQCAELVAKAVSMVSEEYQIPSSGAVTVVARRGSKLLTVPPGTIDFWWSDLR